MDYKYIVVDGDLTIKGKNADGQEVILEAPIRDTKIIVDQDVDRIAYWDKINVLSRSVTFAARLKEGGVYTVSIPKAPTGVERTARVEVAFEPEGTVRKRVTTAVITEAQKKANAPVDAEIHIDYGQWDATRNGAVTTIEFKWTT